MSISANTVFEVRTAGSDTACSGGFVAGAAGTDRSQADSAFATGTNLAVHASTNTKVLPDGLAVTSADVGNLIQVTTTGTGAAFTVGFYQITAQDGTYWTLDRSPAATSSAGASWALGGALATIGKAAGAMARSNKVFVRAGSGYTIAASIALNATGGNPGGASPPNRLIGYATTRGDGGRATITLSTNTGLTALNCTTNGWIIENFAVNCASLGTSTGINLTSTFSVLRNCKVSAATAAGISVQAGNSFVVENEVTGCTSAAAAAINNTGGGWVRRNWVHDNACPGIIIPPSSTAEGNLVTNNSGASSDGIRPSYNCTVAGNTVYASGRHGINAANSNIVTQEIRNNLLANNGGYGVQGAAAADYPADPSMDGNAYYSNTSGTRNFMDDTTVNPVNGVAPYANALDVILTADPFVARASDDYRLNATAGGGAACRGHGVPTGWPGNSLTVGAPDLGAAQHADAGGGGIGSLVGGGLVR